jgi:hypothetical protein
VPLGVPDLRTLAALLAKAQELFAIAHDPDQILPGFPIGQTGPQLLIDTGRLEAVDAVDGP